MAMRILGAESREFDEIALQKGADAIRGWHRRIRNPHQFLHRLCRMDGCLTALVPPIELREIE